MPGAPADRDEPRLILIADDERGIGDVLAELVQGLGYRSAVARNGRQALELARERPPALLITDLMMPGLDGAGLIAALRDELGAGLPVILVTVASGAASRAAGADAVLPKPFDIDALEALVERLLVAGAHGGR